MRSILLVFLVLASLTRLVGAQTTDSLKLSSSAEPMSMQKNELKLNLLYGVLGLAEVSYERILGENQAVGASVVVGFDQETNYNFSLLPYYRMYFGKKPAAGFFIEGNAIVLNYDVDRYYYDPSNYYSSTDSKSKNSFGAGIAVGGKFLNKSGLFGEVYTGLGRLFSSGYDDIYPRLGITLGKRF